MFSVPDFLDRAKAGAGNVTDYRLAKLIGVTTQAISHYRSGHRAPDGRAILKLCEFSGDDPEHVAACIQAMRAANDDEAALWERVAARLLPALAVVFALTLSDDAGAAPVESVGAGVCVLCLIACGRWAWRVGRLAYLKRGRSGAT